MDCAVLFLGELILCPDIKLTLELSTQLTGPLASVVSCKLSLTSSGPKQREAELLTEGWRILVHSSASLSSTDTFKKPTQMLLKGKQGLLLCGRW